MSKLDDALYEFYNRNSDGSVMQDEVDYAKQDIKDLMLELYQGEHEKCTVNCPHIVDSDFKKKVEAL